MHSKPASLTSNLIALCYSCSRCRDGNKLNPVHTSASECVQEQSNTIDCYLQSWTKYSPKYWVVARDNSSSQQEIEGQPHSISEEEYLTRMEDEEEEQRFDGSLKTVTLNAELEHDENTQRIRGCEWLTWYADKRIHLIAAVTPLRHGR
jgi:hypothetical protein